MRPCAQDAFAACPSPRPSTARQVPDEEVIAQALRDFGRKWQAAPEVQSFLLGPDSGLHPPGSSLGAVGEQILRAAGHLATVTVLRHLGGYRTMCPPPAARDATTHGLPARLGARP